MTCPTCHGVPGGCATCEGSGVVAETTYPHLCALIYEAKLSGQVHFRDGVPKLATIRKETVIIKSA